MVDPRAATYHCEAKKTSYRQTKDGIVVSFVIHPDDVPARMATSPLGTRVLLAVVEVGDDEEPVPQPVEALAPASDPMARATKPERHSPKGYRERAMQVSGMLPTYLPFQRYIAGHNPNRKGPVDDMPEPERIEKATALLRTHLGVQSRKELAGSDVLCAALYRLADDYDVACGRKVA